MPNDTKINATFMRASSALPGYSKRYGSGDNQRTINVRFVKAPQVIEEDSYLDADNGTMARLSQRGAS